MPNIQFVPGNISEREYRLAGVVAPHVSLDSITLIGLAAALQQPPKEIKALIEKGENQIGIRWSTSHILGESELNVGVKIDFHFEFGKREGTAGGLELTCSYVLDYSLNAPPPKETRDELLAAFAKVNAVYNAWPYLREIVHNTFTRMNLPPPLIPIFRAVPVTNKAKEDAADSEASVTSQPAAKSG